MALGGGGGRGEGDRERERGNRGAEKTNAPVSVEIAVVPSQEDLVRKRQWKRDDLDVDL